MIKHNTLAVILTGGQSSRMGRNKAELVSPLHNKTMLDVCHHLFTQAGFSNITESHSFNTHQAHGQLADQFNNIGPLGGIATIFNHYPQATGYVFLPVDLPLISAQLISQLKREGELTGKACYLGQHYLPLYLPRNGYSELYFDKLTRQHGHVKQAHSSKQNGFSIRALLEHVPSQSLALDQRQEQQLFNCNTPEQWYQATLTLSKRELGYE